MTDRKIMSPEEGLQACKALARWFQSQEMSVGEGSGVAALLLGYVIGNKATTDDEIDDGIGNMVNLIRAAARAAMKAKSER